MKIIFKISVLVSLVFSVLGCNKNKEYKITGRMLISCDSVLVNNNQLYITQSPNNPSLFESGRAVLNKDFFTDNQGYFTIVYTKKEAKSNDLEFFFNKNFKYEGIPVYENVDLGDVLLGEQPISFVIKLDVDSSYTQNDTLIYRNLNHPEVRIPGPFQSGVVDTVWNMPFGGVYQYSKGVHYKFLRYNITSSSNVNQSETGFYIPKRCTNDLFEAVIKIE